MNSLKLYNLSLSKSELKQLQTLLSEKENEGCNSWYGDHDQYWKRHEKIKSQVDSLL